MKRSRSPHPLSALLILLCLFTLALSAYPTVTTVVESGSVEAAVERMRAEDAVKEAWERAREAGSYRYTADIVQTTIPLPTVTNIGRTSLQDTLRIEGETNLPDHTMHMTLWSLGGSVLHGETGAEMRVEGDRAYVRKGPKGDQADSWEEVEDFSGGLFGSGSDPMALLATAKDITSQGTETRPLPSLAGGGVTGGEGITFNRYTFRVDGRSYATYVRDQLEQHLAEKGELPSGITLDLPRQFVDMTGEGELWIGADGLPLRQIIHLEFPPRPDDHRIEADITVDLSDFGFGRQVADAGEGGVAVRQGDRGAGEPGALAGSLRSLAGDHPERLVQQAALFVSVLALIAFVALSGRSKKLYTALTLVIIASMVFTPILQSVQAAAFFERHTAPAPEQPQPAVAERPATYSEASPPAELLPSIHYLPSAVQSSVPLSPSSLLQQTGSDTTDTDNDGLTDYQESLLGTNPENPDSDGDLITDTLEVQGFEYPAQTWWYPDPLEIDTNGDTIDDWRECPDAPSCPDTDEDGTPDLFDRDNDGDGVPDKFDTSPFVKSSATFNDAAPLSLILDDLTEGKLTYVDLQIRPVITDHLWYAFNVLDWPEGDVEGQVQDADGRTFYQEDSALSVSPNDNGDLRLVPMLEIRTIGSQDNLPSQEELEPYGIFTRDLQADGLEKAIYVPLYLVIDDVGGARVAFSGKMLYRPDTSWGNAQEVRLAWVVQALVDICREIEDGECIDYDYNQPQVIHTYYDDWTLTGLNVTENHDVDMALVYEDPAADGDRHDDAALIALADGLDGTFLAGRDANGDGQRDVTIAEIYDRFNHTTNAVADEQRWNIPDVLGVVTHTYEHQDAALLTVTMTDTKSILNGVFTDYWSAEAPITPTLMFVREEHHRSTNLDVQSHGDAVSWQGQRLTIDLPRSGDDGLPVQTIAGVKWVPYCYDGGAWDACPTGEYVQDLPGRYPFAGEDDAQASAGLQLGTQMYYMALYVGAMHIVQLGDDVLESNDARSDQSLAAKFAAAQASAGGSTKPGEALIRAIFDALQEINPGTMEDFWQDLGNLAMAAGLTAGGTLKPPAQWPTQLASELDWLAWGGAGGSALSSAVFAISFATDPLNLGRLPAWSEAPSNTFFDDPTVKTSVAGFNTAKSAVDLASSLASIGKIANFLKLSGSNMNKLSNFGKASAFLSLVLDVGQALATFYMETSGMEPFSPQYNMQLAKLFVTCYIAYLLFFLSLTGVGAILVALFCLIDVLVDLIFGFSIKNWLIEKGAKAIYSYKVTVDVDAEGSSLDTSLDDPARGFSAGNTLVAATSVTTTITHKKPGGWSKYHLEHGWYDYTPDFYNKDKLRSTTVKYTLTPDERTVRAKRSEMASDWTVTKLDSYKYRGVAHSGNLEKRTKLTAGINTQVPLTLNTGYALPAYECWVATWVLFVPVTVCLDKTFLSTKSDPPPSPVDMSVAFDIFPTSLDEFYDLTSTGSGGYRLSWDDDFPTLMDADGDGLLSRARGGPDPDDANWDTDADGLPDAYELRLREAGVPADPGKRDTDADGLCDADEVRLGTDLADKDTDNDGLEDGVEVFHRDCTTGDWAGGWTFTGGGITTHVTSDPLNRDTDGDGINDLAEYALGFPYNPGVWNPSPIGLYTELGDEDGFVAPGQSFPYTATVRNNLDRPLYAHGDLVVEYPEVLGVSRDMDVDGTVYAVAVSEDGNDVYVGGDFDSAGGISANNVARWDRATETWYPLGSGVELEEDGYVYAIAISEDGNDVYVGGLFLQAGTLPVICIARWDRAAETWYPLGSGVNGIVRAIAISEDGNDVYVGGDFGNAGGVSANNVVRWDRATETWYPLGNGVSSSDGGSYVRAIAVSEDGNDVYVGGDFDSAGGISANNVARWDRATETWYPLGSGVEENGYVFAIAISEDGNDVYVGGLFLQAGTLPITGIARWNSAVGWSGLGLENAIVYALAVNALGDVYVGGDFGNAGGNPNADWIARWNGVAWAPLGSGLDGSVHAIATNGSQVYAGGAFTGHLAGWNDLLERWTWPDQRFFTLFQGEQASITRTLTADPDAETQVASITNTQRSQLNDTGYAGPWDWESRRESLLQLDAGRRPWHTAVAPLSGGDDDYLVAALVDDASPAGYALSFDGSDDYVTAGNQIDLANTSFTVAFWARRDATGSYHYVVGQGTKSTNYGLHIGFRYNDTFTCAFWDNDLDTPEYTDADWHHWACTYDASDNLRTIYRDGALVAQDIATADYQGSGELGIGRFPGGYYSFNGLIDEVRIWNVARTQAEIEADMYRELKGSEPGLAAYWRFDEGTGSTAYDQTGNDNDGTLVNGPAWDDANVSLLNDGRILVATVDENGFSGTSVYIDDGVYAKHPAPPAIACTGDASGGSACLVAWAEDHDDNYDIYGTIVSPTVGGVNVGTPFLIAATPGDCGVLTLHTLNCQEQDDGFLNPTSEVYIEINDARVWYGDGIKNSSSYDIGAASEFCGSAQAEIWEDDDWPGNDDLLESWWVYARFPGTYSRDIDNDPSSFTGSLDYTVTASNFDEVRPAVASDGTGFLVGWERLVGDGQIWTRRVDVTGTLGAELRLDDKGNDGTEDDFHVDLAWAGDRYLVAWENAGNGGDVWAASVNGDGTYAPGSARAVAATGSKEERPQVAYNPDTGKTLVAYRYGGDEVCGKLVWDHGLSNAFAVGSRGTDGDLDYPRVAYDPIHASWAAAWSARTGDGRSAVNFQALRGNEPGAFALSFDGSDDYVNAGDQIDLANTSFTVAFWARRDATGSDHYVVGQGTQSANLGLHIGFRYNNQFTCAFYGNDLNTPEYTDTDWHHWACTYDADDNLRTIYRDGVLVAQNTATADYQGSGDLYIGRRPWDDHFIGLIDEVRIWDVAHTQAEIEADMYRELKGSEPGLVAYWRFDEGTGGTAHDQTANGNDGTLVNGPAWTSDHAPFPYAIHLVGPRQQYTWPADLLSPGTSLACPQPLGPRTLWLRFDEAPGATTFADDSGNRNAGSCSGAECPAAGIFGQVGAGLRFDGSNYVSVTNRIDLANASFTVAFWARRDATGSNHYVVGQGTESTNRGLHIGFRYNDTFTCAFWGNDLDTPEYTDTDWHHWACTYDEGDNLRTIYRDGVRVITDTATADYQGSGELHIGQRPWGDPYGQGNCFQGLIDEVAIFDRALSAQQVEALYGGPYDAACALTTGDAPWAGDPYRHLYYDRLNLRWPARWMGVVESPEPAVAPVTIDADPPTTSAITSLADGQYLQGAAQTLIIGGIAEDLISGIATVEISIDGSAWEVVSGTESWAYDWQVPVTAGAYTLRTRATDAVGHVFTEPTAITVHVDIYRPDVAYNISSGAIITASQNAEERWIVPLDGTVEDRLDYGGDLGSGVASVEVMLEGSGSIAGQGWQAATLTSPGEQTSGWSLDYVLPLYDDAMNAITDPTGEYTFLVRATDNVDNRTASFTGIPLRIDNAAPVAEITHTGPSNNAITQTLAIAGVITDPGAVAKGLAGLEIAYTPAELVDLWSGTELLLRLDEPAGATTFYDDAGNNDGFCAGPSCPTAGVPGRIGSAAQFDGQDDYVTANSVTSHTLDALSFGAWVYPLKIITTGQEAVLGFHTNTGGNRNVIFYRNQRFQYYDNDISYYPGTTVLSPDKWYHVMVTIDGSGAGKLYVDGVEETSFTTSVRPQINGLFSIGQEWDENPLRTSDWFEGLIDEVVIFDRALSAQQVEALYESPDQGQQIWQAATLAQSGTLVTNTTWSHIVPGSADGLDPGGLEGIYQIDLRGTDMMDNRNDDVASWGQWRGEIDTLAPRVSVDFWQAGTGDTARTQYTCQAEDFNLYEDTFQCPCPVLPSDRYYYDTTWWRTWVTDTTRVYRIETSCIVPGHQSASTALVGACDLYGHCNQDSPDIMLYATQSITSPLDSVVFTPTYGTVLTAANPISVTGGVYANRTLGLKALTVTVDAETVIYTRTWPSETSWEETWSTTWITLTEGAHTLSSMVADHHGFVQTDTHPITVVVDTLPPEIAVPTAVLTTAHRLSQGRVALTGPYTETGGVDAIRVQANAPGSSADPWGNAAAIDSTTWRYAWYLDEEPDGKTFTVTAVITDVAGRSAPHTDTVMVDLVPPAPVTVTLAYTNSQGALTELVPGQTIYDVLSPTLIISWTASSSPDLSHYRAGWTESETPNLSTLNLYVSTRRHEQQVGEAQALYAHVVARDTYGNQQWHTLGPIYTDIATTPDYVTDLAYHGWTESGCTQIGADRELVRNAYARQALTGTQQLHMTWDADALRLAWTGANWDGDGDLFVYFDTGEPGGATVAYNPHALPMTIALPAQNGHQLAADYLIWVEDAYTVTLMHWQGTTWEDLSFPVDNYRLDTTLSPPVTDLYIPFDLLGITDPSAATLRLVALASEEDALRLWAAMPEKNPLNSERVVNTPGVTAASQYFTLTQQYEWTSLGSGLCPNAGQFTDADLHVDITADPPGAEVGYLEHDLLYLTPGAPLDADLDGEPDVDLPLDTFPDLVGQGQVITYTLHYANEGTEVAPGVRITVTARGALQLSSDPLVFDLGDVSAGSGTPIEFTGLVNTSVYTRSIEVDAVVADDIHGSFDWLWIQHDVDTVAPEDVEIVAPLRYIKPYTNTVRGTVYDPSGVPAIALEAQTVPAGTSLPTTDCIDPTPDDGQWACAWNVGAVNNGDQFKLRPLATDRFGNGPTVGDWVTLTVDASPPTITLDAASETALEGAVLGPDDLLVLSGEVEDDQQASGAEICFSQTYGQYCKGISVYPGDAITGTWGYGLEAVGELDNKPQTFNLYGVDGAGNHSDPVSRTYQVDTVPPLVTVSLQVGYLPTATPTLVLSGTVSDGSGVGEMYVDVETPGGGEISTPVVRVGDIWSYTLYPEEAGRYTLMIKARDLKGNVSEYGPFEVIVIAVHIAGLSATNNGPTPLGQATTLTATVTAGSNVAYAWAFGDGEFGSGSVTTHTYPAAGLYTATITASNSISLLTATTTVSIMPADYYYLPLVLRNRVTADYFIYLPFVLKNQ